MSKLTPEEQTIAAFEEALRLASENPLLVSNTDRNALEMALRHLRTKYDRAVKSKGDLKDC